MLLHHTRARGITLIEMVIVLVITGMVIGGIWAGTSVAISNAKKKQFAEDILTIVENTRNYTRQSGTLAGFTSGNSLQQIDDFAKAVFPASILNKHYLDHGVAVQGIYINNYGNTINAFPYAPDRNVSSGYLEIDIGGNLYVNNGIPADACTDLFYNRLAGTQQMADSVGFVRADINGSSPLVLKAPLSLDQAAAACKNVADAHTWMAFYFRL